MIFTPWRSIRTGDKYIMRKSLDIRISNASHDYVFVSKLFPMANVNKKISIVLGKETLFGLNQFIPTNS
jgi:hypothetical protein